MRKKLFNLLRWVLKILILALTLFTLKKGLDVNLRANLKLSKFPQSLDVNVQIDLKSIQNENQTLKPVIIDPINTQINQCSFIPANLTGRVMVKQIVPIETYLEKKYSSVFTLKSGGHWKPNKCVSRSKVAIIVPYRDRYQHLLMFLNHMHDFLQKQQLDYAIYIIEEAPDIKFNRAFLMNIGYKESLKDYEWSCFIFHDVDLVPEDDRNLYYCPFWPRHMSVAVNTLKYKLPYKTIFGGVSAIKREHFELINGFSNSYFGWGGEDDDFAERILSHGLKIIRYPEYIARYYMLLHSKDIPSKHRLNLLNSARERFKTDGLNSMDYTVIKKEYRRLYTWILVSFKENPIA